MCSVRVYTGSALTALHGLLRHPHGCSIADGLQFKRHDHRFRSWHNATAQSVNGADGNDIIILGAVGYTAVASATLNMGSGYGGSGAEKVITTAILSLVDSATTTLTGILTSTASVTTGTSVHLTGVITSEQATRTANSLYLQGNAGNDTIALGDELLIASAATFAGGQGNDYILGGTNVVVWLVQQPLWMALRLTL